MSKAKTLYRTRKFLNRKSFNSVAAIYAEVEVEDEYVWTDLTISDCNRQVSLDFDTGSFNRQSRSNILYKLDTLIETMVSFREALIKAWEEADKRKDESGRKTG